MTSSLAKAVRSLEKRAVISKVTKQQRAIVKALKDVGALNAAATIETILDQQDRAATDGLETVRYMKSKA